MFALYIILLLCYIFKKLKEIYYVLLFIYHVLDVFVYLSCSRCVCYISLRKDASILKSKKMIERKTVKGNDDEGLLASQESNVCMCAYIYTEEAMGGCMCALILMCRWLMDARSCVR